MQIVISVDAAGQMNIAADGDVKSPAQALEMLYRATGPVLEAVIKSTPAGAPRPQIIVPTGFKMGPPPGAVAMKAR